MPRFPCRTRVPPPYTLSNPTCIANYAPTLTRASGKLTSEIAQLEAEKSKLLDRTDKDSDETLKDHLAAVNNDLATARERLAHYGAQIGKAVGFRSTLSESFRN